MKFEEAEGARMWKAEGKAETATKRAPSRNLYICPFGLCLNVNIHTHRIKCPQVRQSPSLAQNNY